MTISLCMIVKNEEEVLARCLESIRGLVDEIIIVDTGSTDATKLIAAQYADKVLDFEWIDDFSAARNFAFDQATMDFQMWLDADDILPEDEREKFWRMKKELTKDIDQVTMKYYTQVDEDGKPLHFSIRERLLNRARNFRWIEPVHECIPLSGNILHSDVCIVHQKPPSDGVSTRNLDIYESIEKSGKELNPRQTYYFARELKDHRRWAKAAYYFRRFLDGGKGWYADNVGACFNLSICYQMLCDWERVLPTLIESFTYDSPSAEICCQIGYHFKGIEKYAIALKWFQLALNLGSEPEAGFVITDYWGYIPNIEACVCCCNLGQHDLARQYNEAALQLKPGSSAALHNRQYLENL